MPEAGPGRSGASQLPGLYVYCIAPGSQEINLGPIGIEGRPVHTLAWRELRALVHQGPAQPYQPAEAAVVAAWAMAHHRVVEAAWKRWGAVLPMAFNTIIRDGQGSAKEALARWLERQYETLNARLVAVAGKAEYAVQLFWDPSVVGRTVATASPEIRKLEEEIGSQPRGLAYMHRQRLERLLAREVEAAAAHHFQEVYGCLSRWADSIRLEKLRQGDAGHRMLANLSCLLAAERSAALKAELDKLGSREGYGLRFAGPLPPYSFAG